MTAGIDEAGASSLQSKRTPTTPERIQRIVDRDEASRSRGVAYDFRACLCEKSITTAEEAIPRLTSMPNEMRRTRRIAESEAGRH